MKTAVKNTKSGAEAIAARIIGALDASYSLVYTDYRDELPDEIAQAWINDGPDAAQDLFWDKHQDWIWDAEQMSIDEIISGEASREEIEQMREFDSIDSVVDAIRERDDSDVFGDLKRNTGYLWMTYDLDLSVDDPAGSMIPHEKYGQVWEAHEAAPREIAEHLGISFNKNKDALIELCSNAAYGGRLELLFNAELEAFDELKNGKKYQFKNVTLAIIDYVNGSGHDVTLDAVTIKWDRSKLEASSFYADDVCGLVEAPFREYTVEAL